MVEAPTVRVRVEDVPLVTEIGLKLALAPDGRPEALRLTVWAEPEVMAVETMEVPLPPWMTVMLFGAVEIEKSFGGGVPAQPGNLKVAIRVFQLKVPLAGMYWFPYQKVQPSTGSTASAL